MKTETVTFAVQTNKGVVEKIGRSYINTPSVNFKGRSTKWFDDSRLLKK